MKIGRHNDDFLNDQFTVRLSVLESIQYAISKLNAPPLDPEEVIGMFISQEDYNEIVLSQKRQDCQVNFIPIGNIKVFYSKWIEKGQYWPIKRKHQLNLSNAIEDLKKEKFIFDYKLSLNGIEFNDFINEKSTDINTDAPNQI